MFKKLSLMLGLFLAIGIRARAQSTLPAQSPVQVTVPWTLPSNCTATQTCQTQIYRMQGACSLSGSGWSLIATTAAQATSYIDKSVIGGTQYGYDLEAIPTGSNNVFSGPSNCASVTSAFIPSAPVLGTPTSP